MYFVSISGDKMTRVSRTVNSWYVGANEYYAKTPASKVNFLKLYCYSVLFALIDRLYCLSSLSFKSGDGH